MAFSWRRTWFILVFGETLQIHCFNWFDICTYHCELFRASSSKNSTHYSVTVTEDTSHDFKWRSPLWIFSGVATDGDDCDGDAIPLIGYLLVVIVMKPGFITGNSWRKSISAVPHPSYIDCSVARFAADGHTCHFSNPDCGAQFTCIVAVNPSWPINLAFGLHHHHCGWSVTASPFPIVLFTALKTMDPASEITSMISLSYTLLRCLWLSIGLELSAVGISVTTLSLICTSTTSAIFTAAVLSICDWLEHQWSRWSWTVSLFDG